MPSCMRYQKKIGSFDKQQWEKSIEVRILDGLNHIHKKSARLKTELIDVDLVRGSSFTKAKPKHGLLTVARLATLRFIFLPLYAHWWLRETSIKVVQLLLFLYILQLVNIAIYTYNVYNLPDNSVEIVSSTEIAIPMLIGWVLTFIHSQIVSTYTGPELKYAKHNKEQYRKRRRSKKCDWSQKFSNPVSDKYLSENDRTEADSQKATTPKSVVFDNFFEVASDHINPQVQIVPDEKSPTHDDDGFESLNGVGSSPSDNGEERASIQHKPLTRKENEMDKSDSDISNIGRPQSACCLTSRRPSNVAFKDLQNFLKPGRYQPRRFIKPETTTADSDTDLESDIDREERSSSRLLSENSPSAAEWIGITTNTEDCSYSSEFDESDGCTWDANFFPTAILSPYCSPSDRVSCTIWEGQEIKKAELSVLDISSSVIARTEQMPENLDYFYIGVFFATLSACVPIIYRLSSSALDSNNEPQLSIVQIILIIFDKLYMSIRALATGTLTFETWGFTVMAIAMVQRWVLQVLFFFLLTVAERTFKQRFLYAKLFSHLTSFQRAKKSNLPHFRLNKVRNIKTWLSVRSYLNKRGPQRSVDVIVSATFIITLLLLSFLSLELLKDSMAFHSQYNLEALFWCLGLGCFLLRFMTLGSEICRKYRNNRSTLITEQINLYLQIERKPHKKNDLMVSNSVLKLAADLLKELETPFKISGFSANTHLYAITKVFILSALSGVLSEMLGFKLKLHKISIK